jgi:hypothetical protein
VGNVAVTLPLVVTVVPANGLAAPDPWISAMVFAVGVGGGSTGSGSGFTVPSAAVGVMAALKTKSAELLLLSAALERFRLLTSVFPAGAPAACVSKVLDVP